MHSILQDKKECYVTGRTDGLHEHHIFYGSSRKMSERHGLKVWLYHLYHVGSDLAVHGGNRSLDIRLKREAQAKFEETHTREEFIKAFGRSYL